jgi:CRP-like cAMP-binding protein
MIYIKNVIYHNSQIIRYMFKEASLTSCDVCVYRSYLFSSLSKHDLARVNLSKKEINYDPGDIIVQQGDKISQFMYLKTGLLKISQQSESSGHQIIGMARPLDFIGLLSVFSEDSFKYTITAIEPSSLCHIDLALFKEIVVNDGSFALKLLEKMSHMNEMVLQNRLQINHRNLRGRIAYILLQFSQDIYHDACFILPISRKEIGELINMRTENVIRILSEFRKDKIIQISGKEIRIVDSHRLQQISEFG